MSSGRSSSSRICSYLGSFIGGGLMGAGGSAILMPFLKHFFSANLDPKTNEFNDWIKYGFILSVALVGAGGKTIYNCMEYRRFVAEQEERERKHQRENDKTRRLLVRELRRRDKRDELIEKDLENLQQGDDSQKKEIYGRLARRVRFQRKSSQQLLDRESRYFTPAELELIVEDANAEGTAEDQQAEQGSARTPKRASPARISPIPSANRNISLTGTPGRVSPRSVFLVESRRIKPASTQPGLPNAVNLDEEDLPTPRPAAHTPRSSRSPSPRPAEAPTPPPRPGAGF